MEDNLQKIFSVLISVFIFFILPLYITYEKVDDISYSLALKITSNFVESVTSKGYISKNMYDEFINALEATHNTYDVKIEHIEKKYTPAYYVYDNNGKVLDVLDYSMYCDKVNDGGVATLKVGAKEYEKFHFVDGKNEPNIVLSYKTSEVKYSNKQILDVLSNTKDTVPYSKLLLTEYASINKNDIASIPYMYANYTSEVLDDGSINSTIDNDNKIYTMNKGDEFSVRIKNTNTSIATILFNMIALGMSKEDNNVRVYINYGGTIGEEEYLNLDKVNK